MPHASEVVLLFILREGVGMWFKGLEEHIGTIITITGSVFLALVSVVWSDYKATKRKLNEIEGNYLARFEDVKEEVRRVEKSILESVSQLNVTLAKEYVSKGECSFFHTHDGGSV